MYNEVIVKAVIVSVILKGTHAHCEAGVSIYQATTPTANCDLFLLRLHHLLRHWCPASWFSVLSHSLNDVVDAEEHACRLHIIRLVVTHMSVKGEEKRRYDSIKRKAAIANLSVSFLCSAPLSKNVLLYQKIG